MKNFFTKTALSVMVMLSFITHTVWSQTTSISGVVKDGGNNETLAGVSILVKGKVIGTISDANGEFNFSVNSAPPMTISASFIGFATQEIEITDANTSGLEIILEEQSLLGQEIIVSASRVEESILESPVSIEKMDILAIQNTASDNYYKAIANLKGVDVATSSINFQIINSRGFASTGNTRFVQLTDGMDTQAPALNFPIGNLNGPSELDVENIELIPGASSALYGPNAFNGILLVNSKSPFEYQGASAFVKTGMNHIGSEADQDAAPMFETSVRYAKAFNNKFAFKVNFSYSKADDWHGTSDVDRNERLNPFPGRPNIGADRLHFMGDEASLNMNILRFSANSSDELGWQTLASTSIGLFATGESAWGFAQNGFLPNHIISSPGYKESSLVDYGAENIKVNLGLYYRLNDELELSYLFNGGFGTSVYTGAQRYSLQNFGITQHRLQLRGDNFYVRTYATIEDSGNSYIAEFLGKRVNDARYGGDVANYLTEYPIHYLRSLFDQGFRSGDNARTVTAQQQLTAHNYAFKTMESKFPLVEGSPEFNAIKESNLEGVVPIGPKFNDQTRLYHAEGQYDFKNEIDFMDLQVGASFRIFDLQSNGTIFPDADGGIQIEEYGYYTQVSKRFANDKVKLSGSLRYDKNENFDGKVNPRFSTVWTFAEGHNLRGSYQTGFRIPTTQGQFIDLNIVTTRLLGGLEENYKKYDLTTNAYTLEAVSKFTDAVFDEFDGIDFNEATANLIATGQFTKAKPVVPEEIKSFEIGYKSLIGNKLAIDVAYFHNTYNNFITQIQIRKASHDLTTNPTAVSSLLNGTALTRTVDAGGNVSFEGNTVQIYTNFDNEVKSHGAVLGLQYSLPSNFILSGNYSWNKLKTEITQGLSEFNTPEHKYNFSFANRKVVKNLGFNITYRWQDAFRWEASFGQGDVAAYSTVDAQVSYKLENLKSIIKLGASNLLNERYVQSYGGPNIGAIYYISVTFDELMN